MVRVSQTEVLPGVYFRITELEGLGKKFIACRFMRLPLTSYGLNRSLCLWPTAMLLCEVKPVLLCYFLLCVRLSGLKDKGPIIRTRHDPPRHYVCMEDRATTPQGWGLS